jgi:hypothetical protein
MTETTQAGTAGRAPTTSRTRRAGLRALALLLVLYLGLGVVQIFLAGLGVFALDGEQLGTAGETALDPHRVLGTVMGVITLLILIAAALARPGRRIVVQAVVLLLVVAGLQGLLASAGEDTALIGGLHAIFGVGSLGLAGRMLADTRALRRQADPDPG